MSERFEVVEVNPNVTTGGGGCLCSETANPDCEGPFAVFFHQEMENNLSPHPVLCFKCAESFVERVAQEDVLAGGEPVEGDYEAPDILTTPEIKERYDQIVDAEVLTVTHAVREDGEVEEIPEV